MATTKKPMSENARRILGVLKDAGVGAKFTYKQVQEMLGLERPAAVVGTITSLSKKGYVDKFKDTDAEGKEISCFALNEDGMSFDPDKVVE